MADSLILMVMALVVFGPRRLPQIGRQIGKLMYEFRKASNDFKFQMEEELRNAEEADRRKKEEERQRSLAAPSRRGTGFGLGRPAASKTTRVSVPWRRHLSAAISAGNSSRRAAEESDSPHHATATGETVCGSATRARYRPSAETADANRSDRSRQPIATESGKQLEPLEPNAAEALNQHG